MGRKLITSICSKCGLVWERRYRPDQGTMCKKCTSTLNALKGVSVITNKPKVGKECMDCGKFSYWIQKSNYCNECIKTRMPKGAEHYNWQGGKCTENYLLRRSTKYKNWRTSVFERDNYTCQKCNKQGVALEADHIKPWAYFKELRFEVNNGRTLCKDCHAQHGWKYSKENLAKLLNNKEIRF